MCYAAMLVAAFKFKHIQASTLRKLACQQEAEVLEKSDGERFKGRRCPMPPTSHRG